MEIERRSGGSSRIRRDRAGLTLSKFLVVGSLEGRFSRSGRLLIGLGFLCRGGKLVLGRQTVGRQTDLVLQEESHIGLE